MHQGRNGVLPESLTKTWAAVDSTKSISLAATDAAFVRYVEAEAEDSWRLIDDLEAVSMELAFDERIAVSFRVDCRDAPSATRIEQSPAAIINQIKASDQLPDGWKTALESLHTSSKGKRMTADLKFDVKLLLHFIY
jgi:hypothetical protein